jgi:hypothetical protein
MFIWDGDFCWELEGDGGDIGNCGHFCDGYFGIIYWKVIMNGFFWDIIIII